MTSTVYTVYKGKSMKASTEIKRIRKRRGLTQKALADALGTTVTTIHRWESEIHTPSEERMEQIRNVEKELRGAA